MLTNLIGGYSWYHHFIKGRQELGTVISSYAQLWGDLNAVSHEYRGQQGLRGRTAHEKHAEGAVIGIAVAFLMDMISNNKKGKNFTWLYKSIPFAAIGIIAYHGQWM